MSAMTQRTTAAVIVAASASLMVAYTLLRRRRHQSAAPTPLAAPSAPDADPKAEHPATEPAEAAAPTAEERRKLAKKAKELGNKRFAGKQYEKAIEEYTKAIELAPDPKHKEVSVFYGNRSQCFAMLDDHVRAEEDSGMAVSIDPKYVKAICRRAMARESQGKLEESFQDLTAACLLSNFENELAKTSMERVLKEVATRKAESQLEEPMRELPSASFIATFVDSFKRYRDLLAAPRRTNSELGAAITKAPTAAAGSALLSEKALGYMAANDYEKAMISWSAALACIPPPETATTPFWKLHQADAESKTALSQWLEVSRAGKVVVSPPLALSMAGMFLHLRGNYQDAMECYDYALELDPRSIETLLKRASLWFEKDRMPDAMADFERAIAADKDHPDIYCHRGQLYILQNKLGDALTDLRKAVSLDGGSVLARIQLGMALHRNQQQSEAQRIFQEAEAAFPDSPDVLNYHGELLVEAGELELARSKFNGALEACAGFALAHVNLGVLELHAHQDLSAAIARCEKAVQVDPLCETAHVHMAHLHLQKLDLQKAIEAYDKAVALLRMKQELVDCYSMREATAAQLHLLTTQPDVYADLIKSAAGGGG